MTKPKHPAFSELSHDEALALLARRNVGRLAFTFHDRVDIEPISYVYSDGWVYARTSQGTKLSTVHHHPFVAFETDEVDGLFDWRSVVVRGTVYFLDPDAGEHERAQYESAVALLRSIDADALTPDDKTPRRRHVVKLYVAEVTGRAASTASPASPHGPNQGNP